MASSRVRGIDLGVFASKEDFKVLSWLGKYNWLDMKALPDRRIELKIILPMRDNNLNQGEYDNLCAKLKNCSKVSGAGSLVQIYEITKALADGPKVFRPTVKQCEAMNEVDLDISVLDYAQPYDTIIYQYPEEFCKTMAVKLGSKRFPVMSICHKDNSSGFIIVSSFFKEGDTITSTMPPRDNFTIEDFIQFRSNGEDPDEAEYKLGQVVQRLSLNFSLLMMQYKVRIDPLDKESWDHHRQMAKSNNSQKQEKGKLLALRDECVISFEQQVDFYEERVERGYCEALETGRMVKPHRRRGHWRMQTYGTMNSLRRRKFIKPLLVHKELFIGDLANTTVIYQGHDK